MNIKKLNAAFHLNEEGLPTKIEIKNLLTDHSFGQPKPLVIPLGMQEDSGRRNGIMAIELLTLAALIYERINEVIPDDNLHVALLHLHAAGDLLHERMENMGLTIVDDTEEAKPDRTFSSTITEVIPIISDRIEFRIVLMEGSSFIINSDQAIALEPKVGSMAIVRDVLGELTITQVIHKDEQQG